MARSGLIAVMLAVSSNHVQSMRVATMRMTRVCVADVQMSRRACCRMRAMLERMVEHAPAQSQDGGGNQREQ